MNDNEYLEIETIISDFEKGLANGQISVDNNLRRIQALAEGETIMRKVREQDLAWIEKLKADMSAIAGMDKLGIMISLIQLKNKYPSEKKILELGRRGIKVFQKLFEISCSVGKQLNAPTDPGQEKIFIDTWTREFG